MPGEHDQSLEEILYGDFYPKKSVICETQGLQIPFAPLCGEYIEYLGPLPDGIIALSNYRFFANGRDTCVVNLPLGLIETVEFSTGNAFLITCKNGPYYKLPIENESCTEWHKRLTDAVRGHATLSNCFALAFCAWSRTEGMCSDELLKEILPRCDSVFDREVERMGFCLDPDAKAWRISRVNVDYGVCSTYPKKHIVPFSITDDMIVDMAKYRSHQRFPSVVWRDRRTGLVMARSSQPQSGVFWWRNSNDETFISSIGDSCRSNPGPDLPSNKDESPQPARDLLLIDARSFASAFLNRAKGGGVECQEYYTNALVLFMNLQNIHGIRKSFNHLRQSCGSSYDDATWLTLLDQSKWLLHVSNLLKSALVVVDGMETEKRSVLVHCSDGWDRTPTILSLAQLLLDPYYRTIQGFRDLVEREWLEFGHKFADRCGQGDCSSDLNERSPVFLLWLDCVHQVHQQLPCYFEFNTNFLVKLAQHVHSCLFGDFLYNSDQERCMQTDHKTISVWGFLLNDPKLVNPIYRHTGKVIRPQCFARDMHFWSQVYMRRSPAVLTSRYIEELKSGADIVDDISEGTQAENANEAVNEIEDDVPGHMTQTEIKKRSRSLGRQLSRDGPSAASSPALQSLSLENFESNKLSKQCLEESGNGRSLVEVEFSMIAPLGSDVGQQENKYMSPKISRTKQEEVHQPPMGRDGSSKRISRQMDADGLILEVDFYGDAINKIHEACVFKVEELQRQIEEMRKFRPSEVQKADSEPKDEVLSQGSYPDSSWEMVNKNQSRLVLWVPDHAVTNCFGCEKKFWMGLRRHHCRLCGRIFCFECTKKSMPCPDQLLNSPVRVCEGCYLEAMTT